VGFINSHYMTAAGTLYQSTGFEYYTSSTDPYNYNLTGGGEFHQKIGTSPSFGIPGGVNGPCAGCHMSSDEKHSYKAVVTDGSGTITSAPFCSNASCHFKTPESLTTTKNNFLATLQTVQELLKTKKGIYYNSALYPYFYTAGGAQYKTWGNVQTMGAAFNFNLLTREPGSWAHNPVYTKRLLWDTIDYLDDGMLNQSVTATITSMPMSPYYWGTVFYLDGSRPN